MFAKSIQKFRDLSSFFIYALSLFVIGIIIYVNFFYTTYTYSSWYPLVFENGLISSALKIIIVLFLWILIHFLSKKLNKVGIVIAIILINIVSLWLKYYVIKSFNNAPVADAWFIFDGTDVLHFTDNPAYLMKGMYFGMYPEQLGMTTLLWPIALMFRLDINAYYYSFAWMMQLSILMLTFGAYKIKNEISALWLSLIMNLFVPNLFVVFLIYGDLFSLFFISVAFLYYALFIHSRKTQYEIVHFTILLMMLALAYLARVSTNVILIAIGIVALVWGRSYIRTLGTVLLVSLVLLFTYPLNEKVYYHEKVYLGEYSHPFNSWIRLGTGYSGFDQTTPGFHNYQVDVDLKNLGYSKEKMSQLNTNIIHNQVQTLFENGTFSDFFYEKIKISWTDPDFEMMTLILPYAGHSFEDPRTSSKTELYGSGAFNLTTNTPFGSWLTSHYYDIRKYEKVLYFGILISIFLSMFKKRADLIDYFFRLITIGFFLLQLLIEIKSRYVYVYMNVMLIYGALYFPDVLDRLVQFINVWIHHHMSIKKAR